MHQIQRLPTLRRSSRRHNTSTPCITIQNSRKFIIRIIQWSTEIDFRMRHDLQHSRTDARGVPGLLLKGCVGAEHGAEGVIRGFNHVMADIPLP